MSKFEDRIFSLLRQVSLFVQKEKTYPDLSYKGAPLRYDFFIPNGAQGILIECDGEQHFKFVKHFYKNNKGFLHMQENDRRKNKYALIHNIPLYRIPYYDLDSIHYIQDCFRPRYRVTNIYHNDEIRRRLGKK